MASIRFKRFDKDNLRVYEIRYRNQSMIWTAPEGWSQKTIDKELSRVASDFEKKCPTIKESASRSWTFQEYAERVIDLKKSEGIKYSSIQFYSYILNRLIEVGFASKKLLKINASDLNDLYALLGSEGQNKNNKKKLSQKTILEYHRFIHLVYEYAIQEKALTRVFHNVAKEIKRPKRTKPNIQTYEIEDISKILNAVSRKGLKWEAYTHLLLATGMRRGEALALKWEDIDWDHNIAHINKSLAYSKERGIYAETTKTGDERYISIAQQALDILLKWKKEQDKYAMVLGSKWQDSGFIFTRDNGLPMHPTTPTGFYSDLSRESGIKMNPHKFRHFQASILIDQGVSVVAVSKRLGHNDVSTTSDIYAHWLKKTDARASEAFESIIYNSK